MLPLSSGLIVKKSFLFGPVGVRFPHLCFLGSVGASTAAISSFWLFDSVASGFRPLKVALRLLEDRFSFVMSSASAILGFQLSVMQDVFNDP